jgi:hypothetical protein
MNSWFAYFIDFFDTIFDDSMGARIRLGSLAPHIQLHKKLSKPRHGRTTQNNYNIYNI